jgi:RNA polymerase sigma-70 factor (family 1)
MSDTPSNELFGQLFEANKDKIYRFAFKLTEDESSAQEITQQCFIRLWENIHQIKAGEDVFPLLFVYVKHLVIDESRKFYRDQKLLAQITSQQQLPLQDNNNQESRIWYKEFNSKLQTVIEKMPEQRKNVYLLSRQQGYSHKEIALQLSISPATVKNHLNSALQYIRKEIRQHYDMDPE